jgi:anthranilate/para-aminobenzoate synthase component I
MTETDEKLPLKDAMKIQEALRPLGYVIEGYRSRDCSSYGGAILYLNFGSNFNSSVEIKTTC